jgi:hypothetical protein
VVLVAVVAVGPKSIYVLIDIILCEFYINFLTVVGISSAFVKGGVSTKPL